MLQPELKFRRDKIRSLMVSQGIDAALITCNANLIRHATAGRVLSVTKSDSKSTRHPVCSPHETKNWNREWSLLVKSLSRNIVLPDYRSGRNRKLLG